MRELISPFTLGLAPKTSVYVLFENHRGGSAGGEGVVQALESISQIADGILWQDTFTSIR